MNKINFLNHKFIISFVLVVCFVFLNLDTIHAMENNGEDDMRACWICFLDMELYLKDLSEEEFHDKITQMYQTIINQDLNTVIVQVKAMGDTIYPSAYFDYGYYITSSADGPSYDPLEIMIQLAKDMNLRFEAWVNPYRLSRNNETTEQYKKTDYYEKYFDYTIEYTNSNGETALSLDPSKKESIAVIEGVIRELIECYDIKHIHFDDYFYIPGINDTLSSGEKKQNVNEMIRSVYSLVHSYGEEYTFGISPGGNLVSCENEGADISTWLSEQGYVDYIMPQIYWSNAYLKEDEVVSLYNNRCKEWSELNLLDLPIYVGLALYRCNEKSETDLGWSGSQDNLFLQYQYAHDIGFDGFSLFRYAWLEDAGTFVELDNLKTYLTNLDDLKPKEEGNNGINSITDLPYAQDNFLQKREDGFIFCNAYGKNKGWILNVEQNDFAFNETGGGFSLLKINLGNIYTKNDALSSNVMYSCKMTDTEWTEVSYENEVCGDIERNKSIIAVRIWLGEQFHKQYSVSYRVSNQEMEWSDWKFDGETAQLEENEMINGIQIRIIPRNTFKNIKNLLHFSK